MDNMKLDAIGLRKCTLLSPIWTMLFKAS